ncbi:MAG TPA: tRNA 2-thiouridine(34) synthase MnmA [Bacteroidales bacterium]|nr:tRNA 2-thiouridine(34) synthase MnmA [Bacteroidales bacterium]
MTKKKVVVGISGGVDSSVAAYLLKQQGYDVIGLFMINWHDTEGTLSGDCPWNDDLIFAELVARKLEIPFHTVDFSEQYRKRVVDYMFSEYEKGRTPNPDVLCNREVKFDLFLDAAMKMDADYIATGHYCMKEMITDENGKEIYRLMAGADKNKDQSYFLCQLSQKQLEKALFPIGHLQKPEVRQIADENGLATAQRKDSQGICFVGKVDLPVFLQQKLKSKEGAIVEIPDDLALYKTNEATQVDHEALKLLSTPYLYKAVDGVVVGKHNGAQFFTIGQRKGLNVGGKAKPLFVIATDTESNIIYVGQGDDHPGLNRKALFIKKDDIHWIRGDKAIQTGEVLHCQVRIRYRQPLQKATLYMFDEGMYIYFDKLQRGITPGQFAAWYVDEELMGSGVIQS